MKQIVSLITLVFMLVTNISAQNGKYTYIRYGNNLDKFRGTWIYQSNDTVFKISIQERGTRILYGPHTTHISYCLFGGYSLQVRGIMEENNIGDTPKTWTSEDAKRPTHVTIVIRSFYDDNGEIFSDKACIQFYDQKMKHDDGTGITNNNLTIQLLSPSKLRWRLNDIRYKYSVPTDIIMTKEE